MTSRFKKLAAASAVTIGLAGVAVPASAAVLGGAAEAVLAPLVVWAGGSFNIAECNNQFPAPPPPPLLQCIAGGYTPAVDTLIEVWIPGSVGFDDIPNIYTARNTTPTNVPTALTPVDPDLLVPATARIHWYWFDQRSVHQASESIPVTPDDVVQISWTEQANGQYENEPGYMVIANESARNGGSAAFSMFANAWLTGGLHFDPPDGRGFPSGIGFPLIGASIPVLGMNDGIDGPNTPGNNCAQPTVLDSVKYRGGVPCAVSPLIAGFRTGRNDLQYDLFAWDVAMSNRLLPTIHVVWLDQNLAIPSALGLIPNQAGINQAYPGNTAFVSPTARVDVFDLDEVSCDTTIQLPNELNVIWIPPAFESDENSLLPWNQPFQWGTINDLLCVANAALPDALLTAGFVRYSIDEYIDSPPVPPGRAQSSGFSFAIKIDGGFVSNDAGPLPDAFVLMLESSLGHDLGTFKFF